MTLVNTQRLSTRAFGPETAKTLVFLHGGGGAGWMWEPVIAHLPEYYCLAPDLPEHGDSRHIGPFTMPFAAEKVAGLIQERTNGGAAVVIGLSEGAQVAVQLLAQSPERVEKAIISSALLHPIPGSRFLTPGVMRWSYRLSVAPLKNNDFWIRLNMKYAAGIPEAYFPSFKKDFQAMTESGFTNLMIANQQFRLPHGLDTVSAPTLVIAGKREYKAMQQSARDLAAVLPHGKAAQVNLGSNASLAEEHNWALVQPLLFARAVRAWVEGTSLPEALETM